MQDGSSASTLPNQGSKGVVGSRARKDYTTAGPAKIPLEIEHGTKRKFEEIEEAEEEPSFSKEEIWADQVQMTRKYLTENHKQMSEQGVDLPSFKPYSMYR